MSAPRKVSLAARGTSDFVSALNLRVSMAEAWREACDDVAASEPNPFASFAAVIDALEGLGLLPPDATFEQFERVIGEGKTPHHAAWHLLAQAEGL